MTQVKLWQIVSQTPNAIIFSDADGNMKTLPVGTADQVLVVGADGSPAWADNAALATALQAQTDAANVLTAAKAYTEAQISALVGGAPQALDTLNELAQKLAGDESAINALIAQMSGKASQTEVVTQVAQAKTDAIAAAAVDATNKASAAQSTAIQTSRDYTDARATAALNTASADATNKANAAQSAAITAAAADASNKANAAQNAAISTAADDASAKVAGLRDAIPGSFVVEGTSTACFLASSSTLNPDEATNEGMLVTERFSELTGAAVAANDASLTAKLLFINGVAASDDWAAIKDGNGQLRIQMTTRLARHVFDGTENSVMLLAEYKSYNTISPKS